MVSSNDPVRCLYVHVPFCRHKCEYCAFYSEVAGPETVDRYVEALRSELRMVPAALPPRTVFFGGGTPSVLSLRQWDRIFEAMGRANWLGAGEWTIECNPATVSLAQARQWRQAGVNRVSLGVQSFDEALLDRLGRIHSRDDAFRSFDLLRRAGFDNINLDLMFGIPGQTLDLWRQTLAEALALGSEHLSSYEVTYEEDTPLFAQLQAGQFSVDEELVCAMYEELVNTAESNGYRQYEVSNYARHAPPLLVPPPRETARHTDVLPPGPPLSPSGAWPASSEAGEVGAPTKIPGLPNRACQHNVNYWRGGGYHGLGPSAHSFVNGLRTKNWSSIARYCDELARGQRPVESQDPLSPRARAAELAGVGLRMNAGWGFAEFERLTGFDLRREWPAQLAHLIGLGWAAFEADRFHLTRLGLRFADAAAEEFL